MGLDQVQDKGKKSEASSEESSKALVRETQDAAIIAHRDKNPAGTDKAIASVGGTNLDTSLEAQQRLALKAQAKEQKLPSQAIPKNDGSVIDAINSAVSQATSLSTATGFLAYANPFTAGISKGSKLVKVAENIYQSNDKKLTVSKLFGQEAAKLKDQWDKMFESDKTTAVSKPDAPATGLEFSNIFPEKAGQEKIERVSSVDDSASLSQTMMHWLFNENEKPETIPGSDNLFAYTEENKDRTEIRATPGHVHIEKRDGAGQLKTIVDKSDGKTMVLHGNEVVQIENGKEVVKGDGYTVSWDDQGKRHIKLDSGMEVIRDGESVKLIDSSSAVDIRKHMLEKKDSHFSYTDISGDDLAKVTEEKRRQLKEGETYMLAIKGAGLRTIFQNGTTFDVRHNEARLETPDQKVYRFQIEGNKLFLVQDGKLLALDSKESPIKVENGKFKIAELVIDPHELRVQTGCDEKAKICRPGAINLDLRNGMQEWFTNAGQKVVAQVSQNDSTKIADGVSTFENNSFDSKVTISTNSTPAAETADSEHKPENKKPEILSVDLRNTKVESNTVIDEPDKTTIKTTNTVIRKDKTVEFENGPKVIPDGTVQLDKNTYVTNDLKVHSNGWESTAAQSKAPLAELNAQNIALSISNKVSSIYQLAKAGVVRWTEVAALNSALGDVLSLMGSVPPGSPAHAALVKSYALIVEAISIAAPKAELAEKSMSKGMGFLL